MGMFSEIATEGTIASIVKEIEKALSETHNQDARAALKRIGRFALTEFEWSTPDWARPYKELFKA